MRRILTSRQVGQIFPGCPAIQTLHSQGYRRRRRERGREGDKDDDEEMDSRKNITKMRKIVWNRENQFLQTYLSRNCEALLTDVLPPAERASADRPSFGSLSGNTFLAPG